VRSDGSALDLGGQKQRALLALLLLEANRAVSSDRLIEALWEEQPTATAQKALQIYVSQLRKLLGKERVQTQAPGYVLRVEPDELDVVRFQRLQAEGRLHEALALWRGPPLAEFAYDRFAQSEIARLEELRLVCLEERIERDLARGRHAALVGELEALSNEHPLRERLLGQLLLALYRSGRQAEALDKYQTSRRVLVEELGIEPGQLLRDLHQQILRQDAALELASMAEPASETPRSPLVGRESEVAELIVGLDDAFAGRGRLFLLAGEPGIGKSRLAEELISQARARGAQVLIGRCWEAGGAPAYWPWVQSLRACVRQTPSAVLGTQLGAGASELAQLLPELREDFPDLPRPSAVEPDVARFRLFEAVSAFLRNVAHVRPLVVVLDDLHAADEPSLLLLRFLSRHLGDSHFLLVGTYRDVDPTVRDPLASTLAELAREQMTKRLELRGLTVTDVARYIELSVGAAPQEELIATIHSETEGNPLFVGEVVRLLASEGRLADLDVPALWTLGIPQGVREVIGRRVGRLSADCASVLTLAAVLGREFEVDALEQLCDRQGGQLLDVLDEAVAARVLASVPGARGRLRFAHAQIRETLYDQLTSVRKGQLHRRAGDALETVYAHDPEPHLAELAYHFFEAAPGGDIEKAVFYARRAGGRALVLLAYEEGARFYELALQALELEQSAKPLERCDLLLALGDALAKSGSTPEAKRTLLAAADLARVAGLAEHLARAAIGYGGRFPWLRAGNDQRLVPLLEEALAALGAEESELRVRLLARLAGALRDQPSVEPRSSISREAVAIARRLGDPETLGYALVSLATATWGPDVNELVEIVDEVKRLADETGDAERMFQWGWLQHIIWMSLGETSRLADVAETHRAVADELKQPSQQWYSTVMRSVLVLFQGDLVEAERLAEKALEIGRRAQSWDADFSYRIMMFALRREQGRLIEVEDLMRRSVEEYVGYRSFRCLVALLDCELGHGSEARAQFDELAASEFGWLPRDGEWLFNLSILAEVSAQLEDGHRAEALYALLLPYAPMNAQVTAEIAIGSVARYLGILAATTERLDDAAGHFEEAIAMNERMGARPWLAHTQHDYARTLLIRRAAGDAQRSAELLAAARRTAEELGMTALSKAIASGGFAAATV
jgi:DNA-binding SARP family transcriptional activator/tetratricopeptide (TPR) repeat protein